MLAVRFVEGSLGIMCDSSFDPMQLDDPIAKAALNASVPIIKQLSIKYGLPQTGLASMQAIADGTGSRGRMLARSNSNKCLSTMCVLDELVNKSIKLIFCPKGS